ncbi:MAG: serine hydrolase [Dokdonella sp.]
MPTCQRVAAIALSIAMSFGFPSSACAQRDSETAATNDDLAGLWKAQRWFGPDVRGHLDITQEKDGWHADIAGYAVPVTAAGDALSFELPNGQGHFEGRLERTRILGHWYPPPSSATFAGGIFVSPVRLKKERDGHWSGTLEPAEDTFSFHLLVKSRTDGSFDVILRNNERDLGMQLGANHLTRDGNTLMLSGTRRGQTESRELARGSWDAEHQTIRLVFADRGGSYDFTRDGDDSTFYPRGRVPTPYRWHRPPARDDGWPTATLEEAGIHRAAIERFVQRIVDAPMDAVDAPIVHGVLIARHGKLVLEEYFHGEQRDALHDTRSASKSLTSVIVGAALRAGPSLKLDSGVYAVMTGNESPETLDPRKRAMTLENLLTMSSGYWCDDTDAAAPGNEETMLDQSAQADYYHYALDVPMTTTPGDKAVYCSINANLALGMVARARGESPLYAFDRLVGDPLQIEHYGWLLDPAGNPYGGGSVRMRPRDFMKLGQLMIDDGRWHGQRIIDHDFVKRASSPLYHLRNIQYGYLWWGEDFPYGSGSVHAFMALGTGGQSLLVVPQLDLVVAIYAGNYASRRALDMGHHYLPRYILPAVSTGRASDNAEVGDREYTTPYGASKDGSRIRRP